MFLLFAGYLVYFIKHLTLLQLPMPIHSISIPHVEKQGDGRIVEIIVLAV